MPKVAIGSRNISSYARNSKQIRGSFLEFFRAKEHALVPPAKVFGMKDGSSFALAFNRRIVTGEQTPISRRIANSQKCIRLDDIEQVGVDNYHHSFFEMLGNWSFGDYGKEEACRFAWEYLTDVIGIEKNRLRFTYFNGSEELEPDLEARDIWLRIGVPDAHIVGFGAEHNFWKMGATSLKCLNMREWSWSCFKEVYGSQYLRTLRCLDLSEWSSSPRRGHWTTIYRRIDAETRQRWRENCVRSTIVSVSLG